jgi:hypothetical protein
MFSTLSEDDRREAANKMRVQGSNFAKCIGNAWIIADITNRPILETAFNDLFICYTDKVPGKMDRSPNVFIRAFQAINKFIHLPVIRKGEDHGGI